MNKYFAVSARGIESVTAAELERLGATDVRAKTGGVEFFGDLGILYKALFWLRTATRVLRPLREFAAATPEMLYDQTRRVKWEEFLNPAKTLAVHATIEGASRVARGGAKPQAARHAKRTRRKSKPKRNAGAPKGITHSMFAALKIKDAIVDRLRKEQGARPDVDRERPDVLVHAHFSRGRCALSLDATGASMHERGYRVETTAAPLKETLAAAIVELSGWNGLVPFYDPMCGSGTLVIEAALKALRIAPGLLRPSFACQRWPDFDRALWKQVEDDARIQRLDRPPAPLFGSDVDDAAVRAAQTNARRAGVGHAVRIFGQSIEDARPPIDVPGVIVTNPPYGARLGEEADLADFYERLGELLEHRFGGWTAWVLAGNLTLARKIGLTAGAKIKLFNGPLPCRLLKFKLKPT